MQCLSCGGAFEWAGNGQYARCTRCLALFTNQGGVITPIQVQAPGGGNNPEFNQMFAQNLGFGPPPAGAGGGGHQGGGGAYGQAPQQHNLAAGTFDMGGGQQLQLSIDGKSPENYLKNKASNMIWGWIIGAAILAIMVLTGVGFGIYIYTQSKEPSPVAAAAAAKAAAWDGKSTFECKGGDVVTLNGVKANVSGTAIKTSGACQLTLVGVDITAAVGIDASASSKVTMTGGSINASQNSVVAAAAAKVDLVGTKVTGKPKVSGAAKVTGAN